MSRTIQATLAVMTLGALFLLGCYRFLLFEGPLTASDERSFLIFAVIVVLPAIAVNRIKVTALTTSFMFYFSLIFVALWGFDLFFALEYFSTHESVLIVIAGLVTSVLVSALLFPKAQLPWKRMQSE
ncbi:hypothetical protein [Halobacillus salinus]|uniref:Uncharacterized protein n=1 Tax=Halobacillus salinus TaxID=192814 RepID=A0A4Z0H2N4_9BACI|nr:hypothetical protein [Halobacillus salinus]TGB03435.1 hypothetical protein E4663_00055 [Halobacillus salinus]